MLFLPSLALVNCIFVSHNTFQKCNTCGWRWISVQETDATTTGYAQQMWNMNLDPRFLECNRLHDSQHSGDNNKPLTVRTFFLFHTWFPIQAQSVWTHLWHLPTSGPYLIIRSRSSTVMDLSNQFLPFCSHCHHHISDLHYHNLFCHNTGFTLINPENAIRLIFINCNSGHVTHLLKNFNISPMPREQSQ
jgi:hypothetical protein